MGSIGNKLDSLRQAYPGIRIVDPSSDEYATRRVNVMGRGKDQSPLGFAIPKNAQEVSNLVSWAKSSRTDFCIRSGGNEFYNRSLIDDGLVIDMKDIKFVNISDDKKAVTVGGGILSLDLIKAVEEEGLIVPFGNTGFVGYTGWVTSGGYGPLTHVLGMGFESIVGAEIVDANGKIVQANDEVLEGLRGLGGNLGVVTSLTIKTYPMKKFLTGPVIVDGSDANIRAVSATTTSLEPNKAVLQNILMLDMVQMKSLDLTTSFAWYGDDLKEGHELLDNYVKAVSPVKANMVKESTAAEFLGRMYPQLPFGGVRSACVTDVDAEILDIIVESMKTKPTWGNVTWTGGYKVDHDKLPSNCFGPGDHAFVTFGDIAPDSESHETAKKWSDSLDEALKKAKAFTACSYPPLTKPGTRTAKEMLGDKYERAMELKRKYDPENVFRHALPRLVDE
ncbi:FAD binding domain-containing protein [Sarocladium implicatum]|nr:FAD binding domain-containing protein [Sarocladium implicatum]